MDGYSAPRSRLLRTSADLSGTELVLLQLDHDPETGHTSVADATETTAELEDQRLMELVEWVYHHVEEVWSGFNLLPEAVAKGFEVRMRFKKDQRRVDVWSQHVHIEDKVRMWVKPPASWGPGTAPQGRAQVLLGRARTLR